jgi:hypothetical protein
MSLNEHCRVGHERRIVNRGCAAIAADLVTSRRTRPRPAPAANSAALVVAATQ